MKSASDAEPYSSSRVLFKKKAGFFTVWVPIEWRAMMRSQREITKEIKPKVASAARSLIILHLSV